MRSRGVECSESGGWGRGGALYALGHDDWYQQKQCIALNSSICIHMVFLTRRRSAVKGYYLISWWGAHEKEFMLWFGSESSQLLQLGHLQRRLFCFKCSSAVTSYALLIPFFWDSCYQGHKTNQIWIKFIFVKVTIPWTLFWFCDLDLHHTCFF